MKFDNIAAFFLFIEQLASRPIAAPIFVRCPRAMAAIFEPRRLQESYIASIQYLERAHKNDPVLYCLHPETFDTEQEELLLQYFDNLSKPLIWILPSDAPLFRFEKQGHYLRCTITQEPQEEPLCPSLRELLLPHFRHLPERSTPEMATYLRPWLRAFITELGHSERRDAGLEALSLVLDTLAMPEQHYLFFRQLKWAFYRYLRAVKK